MIKISEIEQLKQKIEYERVRKAARDENERLRQEKVNLRKELFRLKHGNKHARLMGAVRKSGVVAKALGHGLIQAQTRLRESGVFQGSLEEARKDQKKNIKK